MTFFGLNPEHRANVFNQIHEIVYHGNGGYDWETVYNMPIWLRNFTFTKIQEWFDKRIEQEKNASGKTTLGNPKIHRPNIKADYSAKASKN